MARSSAIEWKNPKSKEKEVKVDTKLIDKALSSVTGAALHRGIEIRTIYQLEARFEKCTPEHARQNAIIDTNIKS